MATNNAAHGALVLFGSGPGIGQAVASHFAARAFSKVVLLSRDGKRLEQDAASVRNKAASGTQVLTQVVDLSSPEPELQKVLEEVEHKLDGEPVEVVVYNAARVAPSEIGKFKGQEIELDLRVSVASLYVVASFFLPRIVSTVSSSSTNYNPAFLVTSGDVYRHPIPAVFSLSAGKAAQYNLVHSLHKTFEPQGVHVALVVVGGWVKDEAEVTNANNIALEFYKLYEQPKGTEGKVSVELMEPEYVREALGGIVD